MNPQSWQRVKEVFLGAVEREPAARARFLKEACAGDTGLLAEVQSLLSADDEAGDFIAAPAFGSPDLAAAAADAPAAAVGQRIGAYEIVRELGRGGMGAVYLGVRADAQFDKQVAVKIVRRGMDTEFVLHRFSRERQVLAALDHPNIARLLDGGVTADGLPYFVMEYVGGLPVNAYCDEHRLSVSERLALFRHLCAAVQYAHQHLIVHRDIKPSNILVTSDGTPKLLDFGIAKLLNPPPSAQTVDQTGTFMRLMTPEYASPEQVRGLPITTASDVYSLGVLLYELLTGHRPYRLRSRTAEEVASAVCEQEPERPSAAVGRAAEAPAGGPPETGPALSPEAVAKSRDTEPVNLRRRLAGDLDTIILKALRKEPQRRYASSEQLSEDIRRHLEGLPVTARRDTLAYRGGKFIRRHRAGVAAACLILVSLVTGTGATLWQGHRASLERARAERRFNDVRKLANSFLFEFHDAIKDLPGSTKARALLVRRALEYLDSLSQEAGDDTGLQSELAAAYERVGDVQGNPYYPNVGDAAGGLQSERKALLIRQSLLACDPQNVKLRRDLAVSYREVGYLLEALGDVDEAAANQRDSVSVLEGLVKDDPGDAELRAELAASLHRYGDDLRLGGELTAAMDNLNKALAINKALVAADPTDTSLRFWLSSDYENISSILTTEGDLAGALENERQSLAIREALLEADQVNAHWRRAVGVCHWMIGDALLARGDAAAALNSYRESASFFGPLLAADPASAENRLQMSYVHMRAGDALLKAGDANAATGSYQKALSLGEAAISAGTTNYEIRLNDGRAYFGLGNAYAALAARITSSTQKQKGLWREARDWYQKSQDTYQDLKGRNRLAPIYFSEMDGIARGIRRCNAALARQ